MAKVKWVGLFAVCVLVGAVVGVLLRSPPDKPPSGVSDSAAAETPDARTPDDGLTWTISVGSKPWAVALAPGGDVAYVVNQESGTVTFVETRTRLVTATVSVGRLPSGIALDPAAGLLYVTNNGEDSLSVVDIGKQQVVATIPVGHGPTGIALDGGTAVVTNYGDSTVSIVDLASRSVVGVVPVGKGPSSIALDGQRAFVTDNDDLTVTVVDLLNPSVLGTVTLVDRPYSITVDAAAHEAWVTGADGDSVTGLDTGSLQVKMRWTVGHGPEGIAVDPGSGLAYVSVDSRGLDVIDMHTGTVRTTVDVGTDPKAVAIDLQSHLVVVANSGDRTITVRQPA